MKDRILTFIIGVLVGAIITTLCFFAYSKTNINRMIPNRGEMPQMMQDGNGERPERPSGGVPDDGTVPKIPSNDSTNS